jgi:fatty-acyl-CoA synthase
VWNRIFECDRTFDTTSLEWAFTGTSLVSPELLATLKERFPGTRTTVNYGSTEAGPSVSLPDADLFTKVHAVGLPVPGTRARLADDSELLLSSDWLMSRYYELPDETAAALRDGWYYTGDLADHDDEGYYWIVGRKREIIRTGGESVAPVEVEDVLRSYAGLRDVAVAGVIDERWGEVVCAFVVTEPDQPAPTVEELRSHIGDRLAPFKHPRRIVVTEQLPRTPATGQIQRSALARLAGEATTAAG